MDEDEFAELMRRADPARTATDSRSVDEVRADLMAITRRHTSRAGSHSTARRNRIWPLLTAAAALAIGLVVIPLITPVAPVAYARTPAPLTITPLHDTVDFTLERAHRMLGALPASTATRGATYEGWYLDTEVRPTESVSVITPQVQAIRWQDDLSGEIIVTAGASYVSKAGEYRQPPAGSAPPSGTILSHEKFEPGDMPVLYSLPPPSTVSDMQEYLAAGGADPASDALGVVSAVRFLLGEWTLTAGQHAALLEVIRDREGVSVAGAITDRHHRSAIALRVISQSAPHFETLLLLSAATGQIIGLETIYLGGQPGLNLPTPCVIEYISWT